MFDFRQLTERVAVHVATSEQRRKFLYWLKENGGYNLRSGIESFLARCEEVDMRGETCFALTSTGYGGYCYYGFYQGLNYTIYEFEELGIDEGDCQNDIDNTEIFDFLNGFSGEVSDGHS